MISSEELLSKVPARCDRCQGRADSLCYRCTLKHGAELLSQGACVTGLVHSDGFKAVDSVKVGTATD